MFKSTTACTHCFNNHYTVLEEPYFIFTIAAQIFYSIMEIKYGLLLLQQTTEGKAQKTAKCNQMLENHSQVAICDT